MAAIRPVKTTGAYTPDAVTVKTLVTASVILLQTFGAALGANASFIKPITVRIQAILNMLFVYLNAYILPDLAGTLPGVEFKLHQLEVAAV